MVSLSNFWGLKLLIIYNINHSYIGIYMLTADSRQQSGISGNESELSAVWTMGYGGCSTSVFKRCFLFMARRHNGFM